MLSGHSAAQEIKHLWKFTSDFIGPQILNFERSLGLFPGPQSSLVPPCKILLEALKLESLFLFLFSICAHNYLFNHNLTHHRIWISSIHLLVYIPHNHRSPKLSYLPSFYFIVKSCNFSLLFNFTSWRPTILVLALWVNKRCFSSLIGNYNPGYMLNICDDSDFHRLLILLNKHLFYLLIDLLTFSTYISDLNALAVKELDNMMLFLWSHDSKFVVCMTIWNCTCSFLTQTIIYSTSCNTQQLDKITIKW